MIVFSILSNTICLSFDSYPVNAERARIVEALNYLFFAVFFIEMILKIGGLGFKVYAMDRFNIFDCTIVLLSVMDIIVS